MGSPIPASSGVSTANGAIERFGQAAALEMKRGVRINVVSPVFVKKTMEGMGMDSFTGMPARDVAAVYKECVEGQRNGEVSDAREFAPAGPWTKPNGMKVA